MMRIEAYRFGKMVVEGREYTRDLKIFPERIVDNWWRKEGHKLFLQDIEDIISYSPEVLVVGTGAYGFMKVQEEVREKLRELGIGLVEERTYKAVEVFNEMMQEGKKVCGAFHLTC